MVLFFLFDQVFFGQMGNHTSKKAPETSYAINFNADMHYTTELSSYEAACKLDSDLQSFDTTLHERTNQIINTLAGGVDVRSLSFESLNDNKQNNFAYIKPSLFFLSKYSTISCFV